ncbi:MAG TPA: hypothetical protein GXX37_10335 [Clostridiaceae bacterium]|nr:hypothetical protein [Clostridiaceae bacterium]
MSFRPNADGYCNVSYQLPRYIERKAMEYFEEEERIKKNISTVEEFEKRREEVKKFFFEAIGGLDFEKTPLNDICTGVIDREQYVIKKIIFQSQPGIYVTSNLYVPKNIEGKAPAVLFALGHYEISKAAPLYQKMCIDLVKNGFIVLAVDPISQGERIQCFDKEAGMSLVRWHIEHSYLGFQCELTGSSIIRYLVWDLIRAMDYLCSIPEVDETRIGITGNSGGGIQSTLLMMADDRLSAAAPLTYITSREEYMKIGGAMDNEEISYGAISRGPNHDDFISFFAPKPVLIGGVESDYFTIEGTVKTYERAKLVYRLYGCEDKVKLGMAKGTHALNDELRQIVVNWFIETFKGEPGNFVTNPNMPIEDKKTLQCTKSGQVMDEFPDARTIFELNVDYYKKHKYSYTRDKEEIKHRLKKLLNMPTGKEKIYPRISSEIILDNSAYFMDDIKQSKVIFFSEKDIVVVGMYVEVVGRKADKCTVLVMDEGVNHIHLEDDLLTKLLREGDVFVFDPRGTGVIKSGDIGSTPYYEMYGTEYKLNYNAMMMEKPLTGQRVYDILRACDYIHLRCPNMRIGMAGKGISSIYVLFAAVLNDDVESIYVENMLPSYESIVLNRFYRYDVRYSLYGVLKYLDIPMILDAFSDKKIICYNRPDVGNVKKAR